MDATPVIKGDIRIDPFVEVIHYFWEFLLKCLEIKYWSKQPMEKGDHSFNVVSSTCPWVFRGQTSCLTL